MSIKYKLAQLSLLLTLFVGATAVLPIRQDTIFDGGGNGPIVMGECTGAGGACT